MLVSWWRGRGAAKRALVDFDGVLHTYTRWTGNRPTGKPVEGAHAALALLKQAGFEVVVCTSRPTGPARRWLEAHGFHGLYRRVSNVKWPAIVFFDDRAVAVRQNDGAHLNEQVSEWLFGKVTLATTGEHFVETRGRTQ